MNKIKILLILISLVVLASCNKNQVQEDILAQVEDEILTLTDVYNLYGEDAWNQMTFDEKSETVNQWVNLSLLSNYAKNNGYMEEDSPLRIKIENANKKIISNALISNEINNIEISDEDMYNYYKINQSEFLRPVKEFKIQRIFFYQKSDMEIVKKIIDNNELNYTTAAQKYSAEAIGRNGGYVSKLITKTGSDSLLWNELNKVNKFDVITMPYNDGYIIVRYYDSRENMTNLNFYELKDEIAEIIKQQRINNLYNDLLEEAKYDANIKINL
ncbi:MAG: hypothetical protein PHY08_00475 [Candidatus Cloacimonetes bacterium]|jgi:hypothetical protein|nr:hypothetical protein [Candidatus Cloacimonadota bacterium]MDD4155028.1 hypothetical protein [Candidatus Cloacimonadota bacterium]